MTFDDRFPRNDSSIIGKVRKLRSTVRKAITKVRYLRERARVAGEPAPGPLPFVVVLDGLKPSTNAGLIIRSADAFGARAVYLVGFDHFDVAPTVGTMHNVPHPTFPTFDRAYRELRSEGYTIYALEPIQDLEEQQFLDATELAPKSAFVVGHERHGISFRPSDYPDVRWVAIRQFGAVACLNVANAATVAMYEYARQHGVR